MIKLPEIIVQELLDTDSDECGWHGFHLYAFGSSLVELFREASISDNDRYGEERGTWSIIDYPDNGMCDAAKAYIVEVWEGEVGKLTQLEIDAAWNMAFPDENPKKETLSDARGGK